MLSKSSNQILPCESCYFHSEVALSGIAIPPKSLRLELKCISLNLTAATYVHLVEPQFNPMVEAQAAARVDRLDQDKDIVILRYIVRDSIEEVHASMDSFFLRAS